MDSYNNHFSQSNPVELPATPHFRNDVRGFLLGDELMLFSGASGSLFRANPTSALIWNGLNDGLEWKELIDLLCEAFEKPVEQIATDVEQLISQWQAHGFLESYQESSVVRFGQNNKPTPSLEHPEPIPVREPNSIETRYRLLDNRIQLRLPSAEEAFRVHPILAHLEAPQSCDCNLYLEVRRGRKQYLLLCDGALLDWCADDWGVAPMIHANLHLLAYERCDHLIGMHAAAVVKKKNCILLPASCGSGKSTLTAALVGSGFQYCSDDMVFLTPKPVMMRPAPLAMGIKSGSWELVEKYHPQLSLLSSHERADGKVIRYLSPPAHAGLKTQTGPLKVTHILFPGYREGEKAALSFLTPAQGLCRIAQAGYDVKDGMSEACLEQLVAWIADIPCYEFRYGDLGEAVDFLQAFFQ